MFTPSWRELFANARAEQINTLRDKQVSVFRLMLKDINITYSIYSLLQKHQLSVPGYPGSPGKSPVHAEAQETDCINPS
jgi:hypothetical protein